MLSLCLRNSNSFIHYIIHGSEMPHKQGLIVFHYLTLYTTILSKTGSQDYMALTSGAEVFYPNIYRVKQ